MKLPKQVEIGGHLIKVTEVTGLASRHGECGSFQLSSLTIEIDKGLPDTLKEETLWHEIVEAINAIYELELPHRSIQILGVGIHQSSKWRRK